MRSRLGRGLAECRLTVTQGERLWKSLGIAKVFVFVCVHVSSGLRARVLSMLLVNASSRSTDVKESSRRATDLPGLRSDQLSAGLSGMLWRFQLRLGLGWTLEQRLQKSLDKANNYVSE